MKLEKDKLNGYWLCASKEAFDALVKAGYKAYLSTRREDKGFFVIHALDGCADVFYIVDKKFDTEGKQAYHHNGNFYTIDGGFAEEKELTYDEHQKAVEPFLITEVEPSMIQRTFIITEANVGSFSTSFTISNGMSSMSPEAFIHTLGEMAGKSLGGIKGLRFDVTIEKPRDPHADIKAEYLAAKEAGQIVKEAMRIVNTATMQIYKTESEIGPSDMVDFIPLFSADAKKQEYELRFYEIHWPSVLAWSYANGEFIECEAWTGDSTKAIYETLIGINASNGWFKFDGIANGYKHCRIISTEPKPEWLREIKQ